MFSKKRFAIFMVLMMLVTAACSKKDDDNSATTSTTSSYVEDSSIIKSVKSSSTSSGEQSTTSSSSSSSTSSSSSSEERTMEYVEVTPETITYDTYIRIFYLYLVEDIPFPTSTDDVDFVLTVSSLDETIKILGVASLYNDSIEFFVSGNIKSGSLDPNGDQFYEFDMLSMFHVSIEFIIFSDLLTTYTIEFVLSNGNFADLSIMINQGLTKVDTIMNGVNRTYYDESGINQLEGLAVIARNKVLEISSLVEYETALADILADLVNAIKLVKISAEALQIISEKAIEEVEFVYNGFSKKYYTDENWIALGEIFNQFKIDLLELDTEDAIKNLVITTINDLKAVELNYNPLILLDFYQSNGFWAVLKILNVDYFDIEPSYNQCLLTITVVKGGVTYVATGRGNGEVSRLDGQVGTAFISSQAVGFSYEGDYTASIVLETYQNVLYKTEVTVVGGRATIGKLKNTLSDIFAVFYAENNIYSDKYTADNWKEVGNIYNKLVTDVRNIESVDYVQQLIDKAKEKILAVEQISLSLDDLKQLYLTKVTDSIIIEAYRPEAVAPIDSEKSNVINRMDLASTENEMIQILNDFKAFLRTQPVYLSTSNHGEWWVDFKINGITHPAVGATTYNLTLYNPLTKLSKIISNTMNAGALTMISAENGYRIDPEMGLNFVGTKVNGFTVQGTIIINGITYLVRIISVNGVLQTNFV